MFHLHGIFAIQLLTLVAAAALLAWTGHAHVHAKKLVRAVAYSVGILSILSLLCAAYYGVKYSRAGYFQSPMSMHGMMMMEKRKNGGNMMEGMMDGGKKKGMMNKMEPGEDTSAESETAHSHDHSE